MDIKRPQLEVDHKYEYVQVTSILTLSVYHPGLTK